MYQAFSDLLTDKKHLALISHARPDGDAIGSLLALGLGLRALGYRVSLWNEDGVPARYAFLEEAASIETLPTSLPQGLQALICLDTGSWKRLGDRAAALLAGFPCIINIDHHGSNEGYGQLNIIEPAAAATGMVVHALLRELGAPMTPAIAAALYTAISTDTGSFQYGSTTPEVLRTAAELLEAGVDVAELNRCLYQEKSPGELRTQREVLNHMVSEEGGQLVHYSMSLAVKRELGLSLEDTKDLVDIIRVQAGSKLAIIFEELEEGRVRMSLRSKDARLNVGSIAQQFGGGGHAMAAGIRMRGTLADCRERVLHALRQALRNL